MIKIWTVGLRNDATTKVNMEIALRNEIWGMTTAGKHINIRKGDYVLFIIGLSVLNKDEFKENKELKGFPMLKDSAMASVIDRIKCKVDKVYFGEITTDFYEDHTQMWEPKVQSGTGKKNYFHNRFNWELTHEATKTTLSTRFINSTLYKSILIALRNKKLEPAEVDSIDGITGLLEGLKEQTEEEYQESLGLSEVIDLPTGAIPKKEKK